MKCEKCNKPAQTLTPTLTNGFKGFRRYKLCPNCIANLGQKLVKKIEKKLAK